MRPVAIGLSANGCDRMPGTPLGGYFTIFYVSQPTRGSCGGHGASYRQGKAGEHPDEGLSKIAAVTGGGYFELTSTSDLAATFGRVADELHHQYALGFTPTTLDGKMHTLDVRLAGGGMTARARKSYLARAASPD